MNKKSHRLTALLLTAALLLSFLPSCFAAEVSKTAKIGETIAKWSFDAGVDGWYYGGSG